MGTEALPHVLVLAMAAAGDIAGAARVRVPPPASDFGRISSPPADLLDRSPPAAGERDNN